MSINNNIRFIENIKQGFKKYISWNKYWPEVRIQSKNDNLDYLIEQAIRNINRLFLLSIKNGADDPTKNVFDNYYIPLVQIKDFNTFVDNRPFFDQLLKNKQETYEKPFEMSRNDDFHRKFIRLFIPSLLF